VFFNGRWQRAAGFDFGIVLHDGMPKLVDLRFANYFFCGQRP
jgi:hypothetical protein